MTTPTDMADRHGAALTELAELGLSLARNLHARALAADGRQVGDLTLAFHRVSRSVRQSMALEARLAREHRLALAEAAEAAARERLARVYRKSRAVCEVMSPLIWTEAEGDEDEYDTLIEKVEALVVRRSEEDDFLDMPIEACVARIRIDLGLAAAALVEDDADQADAAPAEAPDARRSSS